MHIKFEAGLPKPEPGDCEPTKTEVDKLVAIWKSSPKDCNDQYKAYENLFLGNRLDQSIAEIERLEAEIARLQAKLEKAEERTMLAAAQNYCSICGNILKGQRQCNSNSTEPPHFA